MASKVTLNGELCFPNDYLSAPELQGKDWTLTISAVSREMLQKKGGKDKKETVARFEKTTKKLVVNKTNAEIIAILYGTKAELWVGKRVTVYPTRCLAFGEMVDCIRVRPTKPSSNGKPPAALAPAEDSPLPGGAEAPLGVEEPAAGDESQVNPAADADMDFSDPMRWKEMCLEALAGRDLTPSEAEKMWKQEMIRRGKVGKESSVDGAARAEIFAACVKGAGGFAKD